MTDAPIDIQDIVVLAIADLVVCIGNYVHQRELEIRRAYRTREQDPEAYEGILPRRPNETRPEEIHLENPILPIRLGRDQSAQTESQCSTPSSTISYFTPPTIPISLIQIQDTDEKTDQRSDEEDQEDSSFEPTAPPHSPISLASQNFDQNYEIRTEEEVEEEQENREEWKKITAEEEQAWDEFHGEPTQEEIEESYRRDQDNFWRNRSEGHREAGVWGPTIIGPNFFDEPEEREELYDDPRDDFDFHNYDNAYLYNEDFE